MFDIPFHINLFISLIELEHTLLCQFISSIEVAICKPRHWNLGIGIGIGIDITNNIISSSIRPMDPKLSRVVT